MKLVKYNETYNKKTLRMRIFYQPSFGSLVVDFFLTHRSRNNLHFSTSKFGHFNFIHAAVARRE